MLAAVLTVSGPWLPARWRHWWWALLLAFVPIHLVRQRHRAGALLAGPGGRLVRRRAGGPGRRHPRARGAAGWLRCVRWPSADSSSPGSGGPARRTAGRWCSRPDAEDPDRRTAVVELYGPHQRSGGALRQLWRKLRLRDTETAPLADLHASRRRASRADGHRHREVGAGQHLDDRRRRPRPGLDALRAQAPQACPSTECAKSTPVARVWESLRKLQRPADLARRPARQRDHRRRRRRALRRLRQRRIRRHRCPTPIRHRPAAGDDVGPVRPQIGGGRGDRRVRQGHHPDARRVG